MPENVNLMNKKLEDLTVKDTLKLNLVVVAATVAVPVAAMCVVSVKDRVHTWRVERQLKKANITKK